MRINSFILTLMLCVFSFMSDSEAQVRKRSSSSKKANTSKEKVKDESSFLDKSYAEVKFGNLGFFNGLSVSSKMNVGYKLHDRFSLGGGFKLFYDQFSVIGLPDPSVFDVGGLVHARAKITNEIYFQGEYAFMNYAKDPDGYNIRGFVVDQSVNTPLIGLGYMSGSDKWRFGIELLFIVNESARDIQGSVVEYWFGASYNF